MINLFRKNQRVLMLVVAVLTIVAFIFLYNTAQLDELAATRNPTIYGQTLTPGAIDRQIKNYQLTLALGQYDLVSKLGGGGADQSMALTDFVWNLLVLQHQSRALGVQPTDADVAARIKGLPVFQTEGQFDPTKYGAFVSEQLAPRGFTERQLEEVMRDALRLDRVSAIVESPAAVGDLEVRDAARVLQPVTGGFVRFDAEAAAAAVKIEPSDISTFYDLNKENLNTRETRSVRFVAFELPKDSKLEGRAKVDALQKLAATAIAFSDALASTPFDQAAAAAGLTVKSTPAFDRKGAPVSPPQEAGQEAVITALAPPAFLLPAVGKASDVVESGDGLYVAELAELNPARPLTLEEATPPIEARLRQAKSAELLQSLAATKIQALREALASGKSFSEAAAAAGLQAEPLDKVAPMNEALTPEQRRALVPTLSLKDGEISGFEPAPWGGFAVYLQSRAPLADAELAEKKAEIEASLLDNKRGLLFAEWLRASREAAKISMPGGPQGG